MRFLNKRELRAKTSLSQNTIDRKEAEGKFPKRVRISKSKDKHGKPNGRVVWVESEVDIWMEDCVREGR